MARQAQVILSFDGVDISSDVQGDLISMTYTDNEEDEADDIQIVLHDRAGRWLKAWLDDVLIAQLNAQSASTKGLSIYAGILCTDWTKPGDTQKLDCGAFELDDISTQGPPAVVTIKGTSLPYKNGIRSTLKSKSWENYRLSGIGQEIARNAGMGYIFDSGYDPVLDRREQNDQTDIAFLKRLCHNAGCSLKLSHGRIIIYDQSKYELAQSVATIRMNSGDYSSYRLRSSESDVAYTTCIVRYMGSGGMIQGQAYTAEYKTESENNKALVVTGHRVGSVNEANILAEKLLRLKNKFEKTATFSMAGNPSIVAGEVMALEDFGAFNGRYSVKKTRHQVTAKGYRTDVYLRNVI